MLGQNAGAAAVVENTVYMKQQTENVIAKHVTAYGSSQVCSGENLSFLF